MPTEMPSELSTSHDHADQPSLHDAPSLLRDDQFSWRAATAASVALAREYVFGTLTERDMPANAIDDAVLLTSELVTNVVEHTDSAIVGVAVTVTATRFVVTVRGSDTTSQPPRPITPRPSDPAAVHGRGLMIVDAIADDWGVGQLPGTAETWFAFNTVAVHPETQAPVVAPSSPQQRARPTLRRRAERKLRAAAGSKGSLWRRITVLVAAVTTLVVAGGVTLGILISKTNAATERRTALGRGVLHAELLEGSVTDQETSLRGYLLSARPSFLEPYRVAIQNWPAVYRAVIDDVALADDRDAVRADTLAVQRLHTQWMRTVAQPEIALASSDLVAAQNAEATGLGKALIDQMRARLGDLKVRNKVARDTELAHEQLLRTWLEGIGAAFGTLLLVVVIGVAFAARRLIVLPVRHLSRAAREVAAGRRDQPVWVPGPQEIVSVAADVEAMRAELLDRIREQEHLIVGLQQHSPTVASLRSALGTVPAYVPRLAVAARTLAGDGVLSGDWYDVIRLDNGKIAITLGDVAGHGPASAVTALAVKHALAAVLMSGAPPEAAISSASAVVTSTGMPTPGLASAFVAILDPASDTLVYANAGHPAAFVWNPFSNEMQTLPATGPILSRLTVGTPTRSRSCVFGPDAVLAVYSDGLTEASPSGARDEYGDNRLYDTLARLIPQHDPAGFLDDHAQLERILTAAFTSVGDHARLITDDATLLIARHIASDALRGGPRRTLAAFSS